MQIKILTILSLFILLLSACTPSNPLDGTAWVLTQLNDQPVLTTTQVLLNFEADQLSGTDGCNLIGGAVAVSASDFVISEGLMTTEMACEPAIMEQASAYTSALMQARSYLWEDTQLTLLDEAGNPLAVFTAQPAD